MKKQLTLAVLTAVGLAALGGMPSMAAQAAEDMHSLAPVVVIGERDAIREVLPGSFVYTKSQTGFLADKDALDVPFTQMNFTEKAMTTFTAPDKPMDALLANSPSVRQSGSILHGDFFFRGFRTNGTNFYVNNVPGVFTQFNTPLFPIESLELVSGPNIGIYGTGVQYETTNPGGIVSVKSKVAPDEGVLNYTQTISGRGLFGEYIDWGERFGENKEWGVRIMTENLNGKTSVKNTKLNGQGIFANIDRTTETMKDNLFVGYRNMMIQGGLRWFILGGDVKTLPQVPSGDSDFSFDGMKKGTHGWLLTFNHDQKLNENFDVFFNFGMQRNNLDRHMMANGGSGYTLRQDGTFDVTAKAGVTPQEFYYWQLGSVAHFQTGDVKHDLTVSYNQAWRNRKSAYDTGNRADENKAFKIGTGSLRDGITLSETLPERYYETLAYVNSRWNNKTRVKSISAVDYMSYNNWDVVLGVHRHEATSRSYQWNGQTTNLKGIDTVVTKDTAPLYGIIYHPTENSSIYFSHSENFDCGVGVNTTFENSGDVMPPLKTKQNEFGVKYKADNLLYTLAYYDIKQDNLMSLYKPGYEKPFQTVDGEAHHKGFEFSANGKLTDKWNIIFGVSKMSATQEKLSEVVDKAAKGKVVYETKADGSFKLDNEGNKIIKHVIDPKTNKVITKQNPAEGKSVNGISEWTAVVGLEYNPNEDWSILGRAIYTGRSPIKNEAMWAPGYTVFDLGVTHKTEIAGNPMDLSLMCNNVFDKDYWMVSRGNQVYLSLPRTFTFSATIHF